ncbi:MAG: beta-phosphoglucomutase [Elusimicrobiota bacterium]
MNEKGVIFDLDGVIVNTAKFHYLGWKKLADEIGIPFDEVKNEKLKGVNRRDSLIALLGRMPDEKTINELCDRKNKYYLEFVAKIDRSEILPGAMKMIESIKQKNGWKQALASSSKNARLVLNKLDIDKYFNAIVDGSETERAKPDPELFLKAASRMGLTKDDVVVVEDAESGVEAAKRGGMLCIGLGDPKILGKADVVVKDLSYIDIEKIERLFVK